MKRLLFAVFVFLPFLVFSKPSENKNLIALEDSLQKYGPKIFTGFDKDKFPANEKFLGFMRQALNSEGAFDYPFDSLPFIARLTAPDNAFRIFNWNLPKDDGTHSYFCFMLVNDAKITENKHGSKKKKTFTLYELADHSDEIRNPELSTLSADKWYGALYYKIILTKDHKKNYYTLLAWDGNTPLTWKKIIEVVTFGKEGEPIFGEKNIFSRGKRSCKRVIFEFRAELIMTLHWEDDNNRIVYDHLAPEVDNAQGMYQYYSQSFTYDSFVWKKGKWLEVDGVKVENPKSKEDDHYHAPQGDQNPH
ncbi:MAG: hypothetical protein HY064_03220 [Bacteroidetes bacterium]|nr:hypothetical protein [Bacteroidota bacterium]